MSERPTLPSPSAEALATLELLYKQVNVQGDRLAGRNSSYQTLSTALFAGFAAAVGRVEWPAMAGVSLAGLLIASAWTITLRRSRWYQSVWQTQAGLYLRSTPELARIFAPTIGEYPIPRTSGASTAAVQTAVAVLFSIAWTLAAAYSLYRSVRL